MSELARKLAGRAADLIRSRPTAWALVLILAVGVWMRTYRFGAPITDQHAFRQTQTAGTVWMWDRFGFDFLDYRVPVFGGGHWVLELPTYQLAVLGLVKVFGFHEELGRVVSIAAYVAGALLLHAIARRMLERRFAALAAVFVYSFLPALVFYYRAVLIDPFTITLALGLVYALLRFSEGSSWRWWGVAAGLLPLVVLTKATIFVAFALPAVSLALRGLSHRGRDWRLWPATIVATGATAVLSVLWTRHGDRLTPPNLRLDKLRDWYFGSRIGDVELYSSVLQRLTDNLQWLGVVLVVVGLVAIAGGSLRHRRELLLFLASNLLAVVIFANLNAVHDYYQLPWYVPLALVAGAGAGWIWDLLARTPPRTRMTGAVSMLLVLGLLFQIALMRGYFAAGTVNGDWVSYGHNVKASTPEGRRVIFVSEGADPNDPIVPFIARRRAWQIDKSQSVEFARAAASDPALGGVVVSKGSTGVPGYVTRLVADRGFRVSFEDPFIVVYRS